MKKIALLTTAATILFAGNALADDLAVKFKGSFTFEGAGLKQSQLTNSEKYITPNRKNLATNTFAYFSTRIESENDMMKYGAHLSLFPATQASGANSLDRSHIFMESCAGKLEVGSNWDAAAKMRITALTIAKASGNDAADYAMLNIKDSAGNDIITQSLFPSFHLDKLDAKGREGSRKITYYTPEYRGLQLGVSYIPDAANFGSLSLSGSDPENATKRYAVGNLEYLEQKTVKDAVSAGITFDHHFSEINSFKIALTGEYGKPVSKGKILDNTTNITTRYKIPKLNAYNIGGIFTSGNFSLVGSFTDSGKSLHSAEVFGPGARVRYYSAGAVYEQGPAGISLSYYKADKYKNKSDTYVLGTEYKLAPGLLPYAEIAYFNGKGKLPAVYKDPTKRKYKGMVFLLGLNLSF